MNPFQNLSNRLRILPGHSASRPFCFYMTLPEITQYFSIDDTPRLVEHDYEELYLYDVHLQEYRSGFMSGRQCMASPVVVCHDVFVRAQMPITVFEISIGGYRIPFAFRSFVKTKNDQVLSDFYIYQQGISRFFDIYNELRPRMVQGLYQDNTYDSKLTWAFGHLSIYGELIRKYNYSTYTPLRVENLIHDRRASFPEVVELYRQPNNSEEILLAIDKSMQWRTSLEDLALNDALCITEMLNSMSGYDTAMPTSPSVASYHGTVFDMEFYAELLKLIKYPMLNYTSGSDIMYDIIQPLEACAAVYGKHISKVHKDNDSFIVIFYADEPVGEVFSIPSLLLTLPVFNAF